MHSEILRTFGFNIQSFPWNDACTKRNVIALTSMGLLAPLSLMYRLVHLVEDNLMLTLNNSFALVYEVCNVAELLV